MTWNGNNNSDWFHPDNWRSCGIHNENTEVTIPSTDSLYPRVNNEVTCKITTIR